MIKNQSNGSKISISVLGIGVTIVILGASLSLMVFLYRFGVGNQTLDFSQLLKDFRVGAILYVAGQQALISCFVSFCLAVPISSILAKRYHWHIFPPLFGMLGLVLVMPTTVAAVGILKVWGLNGWLAQVFDTISFGTGLNNLKSRYSHLSSKEVLIINNEKEFKVTIPLIKLTD